MSHFDSRAWTLWVCVMEWKTTRRNWSENEIMPKKKPLQRRLKLHFSRLVSFYFIFLHPIPQHSNVFALKVRRQCDLHGRRIYNKISCEYVPSKWTRKFLVELPVAHIRANICVHKRYFAFTWNENCVLKRYWT